MLSECCSLATKSYLVFLLLWMIRYKQLFHSTQPFVCGSCMSRAVYCWATPFPDFAWRWQFVCECRWETSLQPACGVSSSQAIKCVLCWHHCRQLKATNLQTKQHLQPRLKSTAASTSSSTAKRLQVSKQRSCCEDTCTGNGTHVRVSVVHMHWCTD